MEATRLGLGVLPTIIVDPDDLPDIVAAVVYSLAERDDLCLLGLEGMFRVMWIVEESHGLNQILVSM